MLLELLRRQYNYRLGERFSWWSENRCPVNACPKVHANSSTKRPSRLLLSKKIWSILKTSFLPTS
nr:hypothetical protein [Okeania sp. KiyG1]